jgi:hypothetical protein
MKRYIEIVYDNSSSMNDMIGRKTKYHIAQELFEKEILPTVALPGDHVMLRLLGNDCRYGLSSEESLTDQYGTNRAAMLERIKTISHDTSTPLFYTIYDAIAACRNERADQYLIFVLTDGDDTCGRNIEDIIEQDLIDKYVKFYNVLLVQLAVESKISSNNLTAFTSYLGGQTIALNKGESLSDMRNTMRKALRISGFSSELPLEHCYDSQPGFDKSWTEIESLGIDFHQALLLYNKDMLSWKPAMRKKVSALQLAELQFLFGLIFKSGMPDVLVLTMLAQLKKPYYYSHDCIYWDFSAARWKYFIPQNPLHQMENPDAKYEDGIADNDTVLPEDELEEQHFRQEYYHEDKQYVVEEVMQQLLSGEAYTLRHQAGRRIDRQVGYINNPRPRRAKKLKPGDIVIFTKA